MKRFNFSLFGMIKSASLRFNDLAEFQKIKNKKQAMSIAYSIVLLIVVAVLIAGLTPVLSRKLPNISTSSTIKHPKGWYESFNAPDENARYCSECMKKGNKGESWQGPAQYDKIVKKGGECYGDPSCIPYLSPEDKNKTVPFQKYCKPSGRCDAPEKCNNGNCEFKPPKGITKYVVYAIGGGGASGSAVAEDINAVVNQQGNDSYKKNVVGRNNRDGHDNYNDAYLPKGHYLSGTNIVNADFIDLNRYDTSVNYKPEQFENFPDRNSGSQYKNKLKSSIQNPKCATGIFYTVGGKTRNFHIYPTEDADERLAKNVSDKQMIRILKEQNKSDEYEIGNHNLKFKYSNRYYLFTKELGVYSYNQNPKYTLMPEWVTVSGDESKYTHRDIDKVIDSEIDNNSCNASQCPIAYETKGDCFVTKDGKNIVAPITDKYSTAAVVACSGDGASGGDMILTLKRGSAACDWMRPTTCLFDQNKFDPTRVARHVASTDSCDTACENSQSRMTPPGSDARGNYCYIGWRPHYRRPKYTDGTYGDRICVDRQCHYDTYYINRICKFEQYDSELVHCTCDDKYNKPRCQDNNDIEGECADTEFKIKATPDNIANDRNNLRSFLEQNATDAINTNTNNAIDNKISVSDESGSESRYKIDQKGNVYDISNPSKSRYVGSIGTATVDDNGNVSFSQTQLGRLNNILDTDFSRQHEGATSALKQIIGMKGHGDPECKLVRNYVRNAFGGAKGNGICTYKIATVRPSALTKFYTNPNKGYTDSETKPSAATSCGESNRRNGKAAKDAYACINDKCAVAGGGKGGTGGYIECDICTGRGYNGEKGADGEVDNGGEFSRGSRGNSPLTYVKEAYLSVPQGLNQDNYNEDLTGKNITGTKKEPGMYNYRYIWYMPFITKHLMFGTSGDTGDEILTVVNLSEGQTLAVNPGKGAEITDYKSGDNGKKGGNSIVLNKEAKINLVAQGGKGGIGSQKTDEYVLCHISDRQEDNPNRPCYAKLDKDNKVIENNYKRTNYFDSNHKFAGIQAMQPKAGAKGASLKMSKELKLSNVGAGAMGLGTESVSDFICEERHMDKYDKINGDDVGPYEVIRSGGWDEVCRGNSKIRYILPNAKDYTSSTGAVIIIW